jgi:hypothetical protein
VKSNASRHMRHECDVLPRSWLDSEPPGGECLAAPITTASVSVSPLRIAQQRSTGPRSAAKEGRYATTRRRPNGCYEPLVMGVARHEDEQEPDHDHQLRVDRRGRAAVVRAAALPIVRHCASLELPCKRDKSPALGASHRYRALGGKGRLSRQAPASVRVASEWLRAVHAYRSVS